MPKAKQRFRFDKENWVQEKNILNRKFVFLDTFAWSKMATGKDRVFKDLKEILIQSVIDKKIIVAINISLVTEAMERKDSEQAKSILELFDTLSNGVYLSGYSVLFFKELIFTHKSPLELDLYLI